MKNPPHFYQKFEFILINQFKLGEKFRWLRTNFGNWKSDSCELFRWHDQIFFSKDKKLEIKLKDGMEMKIFRFSLSI